MGEWKKTGCVLCAQNCGLEVYVEDNRITKTRGDKDNPRSKGYVCRKGANIAFHQHHKDRLNHPLRRVGDKFERISWEQAISEIAERLKEIIATYGPKSFAYMGGGGQGCHFEAAFGVRLMRALDPLSLQCPCPGAHRHILGPWPHNWQAVPLRHTP